MTKLTPRPIPAAWIPALDAFAEALRAGGASEQTQATRMQHLRHAARALGGSPWAVEGAQLVGWCGRQDWAVETRRARRATLRHRFATRAYAVDRDVLTVQQLLGHASPATTQRYVVVPPEAGRRTVLAAAG